MGKSDDTGSKVDKLLNLQNKQRSETNAKVDELLRLQSQQASEANSKEFMNSVGAAMDLSQIFSEMTTNYLNKCVATRHVGAIYAKGSRDKAVNEIIGPCTVNIGSPKVNRVRIEAPERNKTVNYGKKCTYHHMYLLNKGRVFTEYIGDIEIMDYNEPNEISIVAEMVDFAESFLKRNGYQYIRTLELSIDNRPGAITIGRGSRKGLDSISFQYALDIFTRVIGSLYLPGVLESLHVELKEKRAPPQQVSISGEDITQKLRKLKEMYDEGLITQSEYEAKRQAMLDKI